MGQWIMLYYRKLSKEVCCSTLKMYFYKAPKLQAIFRKSQQSIMLKDLTTNRRIFINVLEVKDEDSLSYFEHTCNRLARQLCRGNQIEDITIMNFSQSARQYLPFMLSVLASGDISKLNKLQLNLGKILHSDFCRVIDNMNRISRFITILTLKGNMLTNQAIYKLASCHFKFVCYLNLSCNLIDCQGARTLSHAGWRYMHELKLGSNMIGNKGLRFLCQADWPHLADLDIQKTNLTDRGVNYFAKGQWPKLKYLNLSKNQLGNDTLRAIIRAQLPSLKYLTINFEGQLTDLRACFPSREVVKLKKENPALAIVCFKDDYQSRARDKIVRRLYPTSCS